MKPSSNLVIAQEREKNLKRLFYAAHAAKEHYQIWIILNKNNAEYNQIKEHYGNFFEPTDIAHFTSALMAICKICCSGINFNSFVAAMNKHALIHQNVLEEIKNQIAQMRPLINKVRMLRDKYFAHNVWDPETAFRQADITPEGMGNLIEATIALLNKISLEFGNAFEYEHDNGFTTYRFLDALKNDQNAVR